jgi:hypothetical protein
MLHHINVMNSDRIKQQQKDLLIEWVNKMYIWIILSGLYLNGYYIRRKIWAVKSLILLIGKLSLCLTN